MSGDPALEVRVDRRTCRGSRACVRRAPGTFSLDAKRRAVVAAHPADPADAIREAALSCPFFAIEVSARDEGRGERRVGYPPAEPRRSDR